MLTKQNPNNPHSLEESSASYHRTDDLGGSNLAARVVYNPSRDKHKLLPRNLNLRVPGRKSKRVGQSWDDLTIKNNNGHLFNHIEYLKIHEPQIKLVKEKGR